MDPLSEFLVMGAVIQMNLLQIKERGLEFEQLGKLPQDVLDFIYNNNCLNCSCQKN